jgi:hypothetical protein
MDIPRFTDLELFLLTGWISYILIHFLADSVRLRFYFKDWKVKVGKPIPQSGVGASLNRAIGGQKNVPNTHSKF